jgi:hypothetical protein
MRDGKMKKGFDILHFFFIFPSHIFLSDSRNDDQTHFFVLLCRILPQR